MKTKFMILGRSRNLDALTDAEFRVGYQIANTLCKMLPHRELEFSCFAIDAQQRRLTRKHFESLADQIKEAQQKRRFSSLTKR